MSAEAERVAHRIAYLTLFALAECVIQVQFVLAGMGVSRQVDEILVDCADAYDRLDGAGTSEEVSRHGLGGVDETFSASSPIAYLIARVS